MLTTCTPFALSPIRADIWRIFYLYMHGGVCASAGLDPADTAGLHVIALSAALRDYPLRALLVARVTRCSRCYGHPRLSLALLTPETPRIEIPPLQTSTSTLNLSSASARW